MHGDEENQQKYQLDEGIQLLQQWIDDHHHHDEKGENGFV